ncbi:hypothetical protein [Psychrobacillus sp. FJAT-21963]|nr:hypothetical protein [Psychrobacillus sp. FJAT-21963]
MIADKSGVDAVATGGSIANVIFAVTALLTIIFKVPNNAGKNEAS